MNTLTIDIGNTSIKYAVFDSNQSMLTEGRIDGHDPTILVTTAKSFSVIHAIVCSTVKLDASTLRQLSSVAQHLVILSHTTSLPIRNLYKSPQTLGMDRLAAAVGAYSQTQSNTLIIDMGTAITYDLVTERGEYLGGNISPGLNMRFNALHQQTALLPLVNIEGNHPAIGNDTETAIRCGVVDGIRYEIEGYISKLSLKYTNLCIILTGGDHLYFEDSKNLRIFADDYIVLKGLNEILRYNLAQTSSQEVEISGPHK